MPRAAVTGGAGFVGSHVCERLLAEGWEVVCLDNLLTGRSENLAACAADRRFELREMDVSRGIQVEGAVDAVIHMASPASPTDYLRHPIATLEVGSLGTLHALGLAVANRSRFVLASTSEVYGDPQVHPQPEHYTGNVDQLSPRGVYDEAKRFGEAATMAHHRVHGLPVAIARIFNTYGPRMRRDDGRAVPTFVQQALAGEPLTVHGDGSQTRSLCYVDDLVEALWRLLGSGFVGPMNLGNPEEVTVRALAARVRDAAASASPIEHVERPLGDPDVRRPDISRAREVLGWEPTVNLGDGLARMVAWAREAWMR